MITDVRSSVNNW